MSRRIRFIILTVCFALFFSITPWLVLYSLGYHVDLKKQRIFGTGGIYVRAEPAGAEVSVDSGKPEKTSFFSNSVFVQNLSADFHNVLVKKEGYFDYQKNISVRKGEVTKIENITLFRKNISFTKINELPDYPVINLKWSTDASKILMETKNGYFVFEPFAENKKAIPLPKMQSTKDVDFNPHNSAEIFYIQKNILKKADISQTKIQHEEILSNILSYKIYDNHIFWLGSDGILYQSEISGKTKKALNLSPLNPNNEDNYKIYVLGSYIFIKDDSLLWLNSQTSNFQTFLDTVTDVKASPDGKNIFYLAGKEIWLDHSNYNYENSGPNPRKVLLNQFYEEISDIYWLNNSYIVLKADKKIKISEIDNRGNINIIDLPDDFEPTQLYFNLQNKKLYMISAKDILISGALY